VLLLNNNFYNHESKRQIKICTVARKRNEFWDELEKKSKHVNGRSKCCEEKPAKKQSREREQKKD